MVIWSDHLPLRFIFKNDSANSRLVKWKLLLQEFAPEIYYIKGCKNVTADWLSRYAGRAPPSEKVVAMREDHTLASFDSALPQAYPETFMPDVWSEHFRSIDLSAFKGPIVVLSDTMSVKAKGPLAELAARLDYVADYFSKRRPYVSPSGYTPPEVPFCRQEDASELGSFVRLTGDGPDVILAFHTRYELTEEDRATELQRIRSLAEPALAEEFRVNNSVQRSFYAHLALEAILRSWASVRPDNVYIIDHVDPRDRSGSKHLTLYK